MRNFFSPFTNLGSHNFTESKPYRVALTVYEQNRKKVFLVTLSDKELLKELKLTSFQHVSFSAATRHDKSCLVIEGSPKLSDGKIVLHKTHMSIRATEPSFLPKAPHKQLIVHAYITEIGDNEQILVIPLPEDYRLVSNNKKEYPISFSTPQPEVESWPPFN